MRYFQAFIGVQQSDAVVIPASAPPNRPPATNLRLVPGPCGSTCLRRNRRDFASRILPKAVLLFFGGWFLGLAGCGREPSYQGKPLTYWKAELRSGDVQRRQQAMDALSEIGRPGVPALVDLLEDKDRQIRKKVVKTLVEMQVGATMEISEWAQGNDDARQILKELCLEEEDEEYFITLAQSGPDALPIFAEFLKSGDRKVAWDAAMALEEMDPPEAAVPLLKEALKNPYREVRERAAESLRACVQVE